MRSFWKRLLVFIFCPFIPFVIISGCSPRLTVQEKSTLGELKDLLNTTIAETDEFITKKHDPTSPYLELNQNLFIMREQIRKMEAGETEYDSALIQEYRDNVTGIMTNIKNPVDRVIGADVSFGLGQYRISELSSEARLVLDELAREIIDDQVIRFRTLFPGKRLFIHIKTVGYADETPAGMELTNKLMDELPQPLPKEKEEKRKTLNKILSKLRAKTINDYVRQQLTALNSDQNCVIGEPAIVGMGETLPYPPDTVEPPYTSRDQRRRICKIHGFILFERKNRTH